MEAPNGHLDLPDLHTHYAVIAIKSGRIFYTGDSLAFAANALQVGRCYGSGETTADAVKDATEHAKQFRVLGDLRRDLKRKLAAARSITPREPSQQPSQQPSRSPAQSPSPVVKESNLE